MENKVSLVKMIMFTICGILALDTLVATAIMGVSSITLWIIIAVFFFVPYGLVTAELGYNYPDDGGIFIWVKKAFGKRQASLVAWYYWLNVAIWMPAVFVAFTKWFSMAFYPDMNMTTMGIISVLLCWVIVGVGIFGVDLSIKVSNFAGICKVIILLFFGITGVIYMIKNGARNSFALKEFIPTFDINTSMIVSTIIYSLLGFELISSIASKVSEPKKNVPKMILISGVLITSLYLTGVFGILVALPKQNIDILDGFYLALKELITVYNINQDLLFKFIISLTLFTLVANMVSWTLGSAEILAHVSFTNKFKVFNLRHKRFDTLYGSYIIMGIIASILLVLNFALGKTANETFWTILAFSFVIFLLPYLWMFASSIKLIKTPYIIPFGKLGLYFCAILGIGFISFSIILLFYTEEFDILYYATLIIGTLISTFIGLNIANGDK